MTTAKMTREKALAMTPEQRGRMLVSALRSLPRKAMPEGFAKVEGDGKFRWRYDTVSESDHCGTSGCAIGLAIALKLMRGDDCFSSGAAESFGIGQMEAHDLFFDPQTYGFRYSDTEGCPYERVTPQAVAKKLEQTLDATYGKTDAA